MSKVINETKEIKIISGDEIHHVKPGTILKVVNGSAETLNSFVIKTDETEYPLIDIEDGELWGDNLQAYEFEKVNVSEIILK